MRKYLDFETVRSIASPPPEEEDSGGGYRKQGKCGG